MHWQQRANRIGKTMSSLIGTSWETFLLLQVSLENILLSHQLQLHLASSFMSGNEILAG